MLIGVAGHRFKTQCRDAAGGELGAGLFFHDVCSLIGGDDRRQKSGVRQVFSVAEIMAEEMVLREVASLDKILLIQFLMKRRPFSRKYVLLACRMSR